jgi:hypothetical protein
MPLGSTVAVPEAVQLNKGGVRVCVDPSEKVPVAVSCTLVPLAIEGFTGLIVIDWRIAAVTVRLVEPVIVACAALMVVLPTLLAVASP